MRPQKSLKTTTRIRRSVPLLGHEPRFSATVSLMLVVATAAVVGVAGQLFASEPSQASQLFFDGAAETRSLVDNESVKTFGDLKGRDARLQLLVSGLADDGIVRDFTRQVDLTVSPTGLVRIDSSGNVVPLANGTAIVTATLRTTDAASESDAQSYAPAQATLHVSGVGSEPAISFPSQIVPIFTKLGCNGGGCHGKAAGQNGFKLSLLGFEPQDDYQRLLRETRGRRVFLAAPERSLLLTKTVNMAPHGGGSRTEVGSYEYRLLHRWIAQGMPYGDGAEPQIQSIAVTPDVRRMNTNTQQQLAVKAIYSDGSVQDVTQAAVFESNDPAMGDVDARGLVSLAASVGDVAVMARYQGHVAVFRAEIPQLPLPTEIQWPSERNVVDQHVYAKLRSMNIPPSPRCSDATYLRRVTIDIAGRLPTAAEQAEFLSQPEDLRRDRLVDQLLGGEDHADYFAAKWNVILRNKRPGVDLEFGTVAFHRWIRESLIDNKPYDQLVGEILTASGSIASNPPVAWLRQVPDTNQRLEDAAQLFLGQRIQCARCHHHPYEKWSQADYGHLAAFFSTVSKRDSGNRELPRFTWRVGGASAKHPKTGQSLPPAGLGADVAPSTAEQDPREQLVHWMTDPSNPFFARSLVNRYWKHFMARGLVEPEDDMRVTNPPSNPELLDAVAEEFVASGFDLQALVRLICTSNTYAASSDAVSGNVGDRKCYSRYYPKRLTAEVMLDAIDTVTGTKTSFAGVPGGTRAVALPDTAFDSYFLTVFGRPEANTACECERAGDANLAQSLHLLNSEAIQEKLAGKTGRAAGFASLSDVDQDAESNVRQLYQIAFSRSPTADELSVSTRYITGKTNHQEAYEDLTWALINSKEFMFNH